MRLCMGWGGLALGQLLESPRNPEQASCTSVYNHEHDTRPPRGNPEGGFQAPQLPPASCHHAHMHTHTCTLARAHALARTLARAHTHKHDMPVCLSPVPSRMEVRVLCLLPCPDPGRPPAHRRPASLRMRPPRLQQLCLREGPALPLPGAGPHPQPSLSSGPAGLGSSGCSFSSPSDLLSLVPTVCAFWELPQALPEPGRTCGSQHTAWGEGRTPRGPGTQRAQGLGRRPKPSLDKNPVSPWCLCVRLVCTCSS